MKSTYFEIERTISALEFAVVDEDLLYPRHLVACLMSKFFPVTAFQILGDDMFLPAFALPFLYSHFSRAHTRRIVVAMRPVDVAVQF
jgi:hypothetical protein